MSLGSLKLISGTANPELSKDIADFIGVSLVKALITSFPDGETSVQVLEDVHGSDVFIIQPTCQPANHNIMELLILIDAVRRAGAARITAVVPFFGYARQDRKDKSGVPITSKLVANLLVAAGAKRLITMDLHSPQITGFFDIPLDHLFAAGVFLEYLKRYRTEALMVVSPDVGGLKLAASYADLLGCPLGIVAKRRIDPETVDSFDLIGSVDGKDIFLIDDMAESGATLAAASRLLKARGAKSIRGIISHGVLTAKGYERLSGGVIDELVTTNSTSINPKGDFPTHILSVARLFGEAILRVHHNERTP